MNLELCQTNVAKFIVFPFVLNIHVAKLHLLFSTFSHLLKFVVHSWQKKNENIVKSSLLLSDNQNPETLRTSLFDK